MRLYALLEGNAETELEDREITGITNDSRNVEEGYLFVCIKGEHFDGHTKAAEMLMVPHLPVESIALSCGYQDPLVFSKAFRQMKGVSPTMYRKQIQQDENRVNREHLKQVEEFISKVGRLELGGEP